SREQSSKVTHTLSNRDLLAECRHTYKGVSEENITVSYTLKEMFKRMENSHMKMLKENTKISQEATKAELRAESRALRLHIRFVIAICSLIVGILARAYMSFLKEMEKINGKKQKCSFLWHYC
ncbi:unnamed protein product, partial [Auanema sp. JU1783]